jgi:hypothetical protein
MNRLQFLSHRVAFGGLPFGELQKILAEVEQGRSWTESCRRCWRRLREMAERAELARDVESAAQAWRWTACAYHAASLGFHFGTDDLRNQTGVIRRRQMAHLAYLRAVRRDPCFARPVRIPYGNAFIEGYLRLARKRRSLAIVLFNGLDSICEVEMHAFGDWLLARGFSVLSLDLPCGLFVRPRQPHLAVEVLAPSIAEWIGDQPTLKADRIGAFGVSFGGHLVARALSGDDRFRAGVAVSPAAWMGPKELGHGRVRLMFSIAFGLCSDEEIEAVANQIQIMEVHPPRARLLVYHMEQDELFGMEHTQAYVAWAPGNVEVRNYCAEHVGTSQIHSWMPEACAWLSRELAPKEEYCPC